MLHLLVKYARDHRLVAESGFKPKQIRWAIGCDNQGKYLHITELGDPEQKRNPGQTFPQCPDLSQPEMKRGGKGCRHFLVDTAEVIALYGQQNTGDPKLLAKHTYFVELLQKASGTLPELRLVAEMLRNPEVLEKIRGTLKGKNGKPTDNMTFALLGRNPMYLVEDDAWHEWWRSFRRTLGRKGATTGDRKTRVSEAKNTPEILMRCLVSGELVAPTPTHPKIEGLSDVGGLSMGDALASFKQDAFRSYGLSQSNNAAVSEEMATTYRSALNHLIRNHSRRLAGTKVVHWYTGEKNIPPENDPMNFLDQGLAFLGEHTEKEQGTSDAQHRAQQLLDALSVGKRGELLNYRYYVLTLSGASGRVMVRDWMEGQFGELAENIATWFKHIEIVHRDQGKLAGMPKFMAVLGGLVREFKDLPSPLVAKMWRVAVKKEPIPQYVMAQALARAKIDVIQDTPANHARMGLIKAYHLRKGDRFMESYLNEDHPHPAYHCGRLMAVLADLQYAALGDVGAGIVQRYYAAASTTPALVLGRLTRLSQFHLNKLEGGLPYWYESRIASIWGRIKDRLPLTLSLEEQSLFALGYYQQKAARKAISEQTTTHN